jgi:hypothetical protein
MANINTKIQINIINIKYTIIYYIGNTVYTISFIISICLKQQQQLLLLLYYISPQSAFFNLSFVPVWKEGLHDQVPVNATASFQAPLCNLLSYGRAFGSA